MISTARIQGFLVRWRSARSRRDRVRGGMSLLELLLALALTVVLMAAISLAIHINLKGLDARRAELEESQLARAVLRMIADDLRGSVQYEVVDFSSVEQMASGMTGNAGALMEAVGGLAGAGSTSASSNSLTSGPTENTQNIAESQAPPDTPGLYGNESEIQIDVSRLPRVDEYSEFTTPEGAIKMPSDLKTVAYYVRQYSLDGVSSPQDDVTPGLNNQGVGLVRRELPRAISQYAIANGTSDFLLQGGDLIAPEVVGMTFRYFSGEEWLSQWDSQQMQGLPIAVEIVLMVRSAHAEKTAARASGGLLESTAGTTGTLAAPLVYRLVVRIPAAQLGRVPPSTDSGSGSSGSSGTGGTSGTTGAGGAG
ncbi:MAG: hypothetical protein FJ295_02885 [Planctomycetes bacterium]|nr:hypothetical protein [Planctomycetota bacterium]